MAASALFIITPAQWQAHHDAPIKVDFRLRALHSLKADLAELGVGAIVARSFARIFYRNALNLGLPALVCADLEAARGDELEVRPAEGRILNHSSGREFACEAIPAQLMEIVAGGGLMPWLERKLAAERDA